MAGKKRGGVALALMAYQTILKDNVFSTAAGMVYSTLMAIVPAFAFYSAFFGAFGILDAFIKQVTMAMDQMVGESVSHAFVTWIEENSRNALSLGLVGLFSFLFTMVLLLNKIWTQVNLIYHTSLKQTLKKRLAGILLFVVVTLTVGAVFLSMQGRIMKANALLQSTLSRTPFSAQLTWLGMLVVVLFLTIKYIPNTKVSSFSALAASIAGSLGIIISNMVLSSLSSLSVRYSMLYGTLAFFFLLLFRLYVLWLIFFWSVEFAYVLQFRPEEAEYEGLESSPALQLCDGINIMMLVGANFRDGKGKTEVGEITRRLAIPGSRLSGFLDVLERLGFIQQVGSGGEAYTVAKPLDSLRIRTLADELYGLDGLSKDDKDTAGEAVARAVRDEGVESLGDLTLENLLERV